MYGGVAGVEPQGSPYADQALKLESRQLAGKVAGEIISLLTMIVRVSYKHSDSNSIWAGKFAGRIYA